MSWLLLGWAACTPRSVAVAPDQLPPPELPTSEVGFIDEDGDGFSAGVDCDDDDPDIHPGAPERCNGLDDDCSQTLPADEQDNDGDGFLGCEECDDGSALSWPGAPELCDGLDNDCDGAAEPTPDNDGDGFIICDDCDDADPAVFPGALELCNGFDDDCDGLLSVPEADLDGDGTPGCLDCDDTNPADTCSDLLDWAEEALEAARGGGPLTTLRGWVLSVAPDPCVSTTTSSEPSPPATLWVPSWGITFLGTPFEVTTTTAPCAAGTGPWAGTAETGVSLSTMADCGVGTCTYDAAWLDATAAEVAGVLALDGALSDIDHHNPWFPDGHYAHDEVQIDASWSIDVASALGPPLQTGDWDVESTYVRSEVALLGACGGSSLQMEHSAWLDSLFFWVPPTGAPRTLGADLDWCYAPPDFYAWPPSSGCAVEPQAGEVTVTGPTSAGTETVTLTFDGATSCDGCGAVEVDGVPTGTWCHGGGFSL